MLQKLSPNFVELTQDACLKVFWRRRALARFLRLHKIAEAKLATWHDDESKSDFLARLFDDLIRMKDNAGHAVILRMARALAEMKYFPDLEKWEDSVQKIKAAKESVARLREKVESLDEQISDRQHDVDRLKRKQAEQEKDSDTRLTPEKLNNRLVELVCQQGTQEGGYAFEQWFYDLAICSEIQPRKAYKTPDGRQVDGALSIGGTEFIVETKFTKEPIGVDQIDSFMAKIESKADNTMGLLVSMAGFEDGAKRQASKPKTPMLLMDHTHVFLILSGQMTLAEVVQRIKRHAAQEGKAFLPVDKFSG
jgi:hypothetical protein